MHVYLTPFAAHERGFSFYALALSLSGLSLLFSSTHFSNTWLQSYPSGGEISAADEDVSWNVSERTSYPSKFLG
jgi:hypothetical protein